MSKQYTEAAFESAIEHHLLTFGGYTKLDPTTFDPARGLDPTVFLAFVQETQPDEWQYLHNLQGDKAAETLLDDLRRALNSEHEGCLKVLRHGFKCFGKLFRAAYFCPATTINPETQRCYAANRLTVTRQLRYSEKHGNTLDLVLSLNGIPVATAELKNPMTAQTWQEAVRQYQDDRDPKDLIFQFKKRTLVHFAVDPDEVHMATQLRGRSTTFLPFNLGDGTGAGNPDNPGGYRTSYLWEQVWQRDSFLDIVARFIHIEVEQKRVGSRRVKREKMIFPRYHQLDAVRKMVADTRARGVGHNYLVQHSAGSGKSNSIAWLAHRLASLHDDQDEKVFDSVVVVTDRLVLDQQLQNTIYQFEHKQGVVQKIDMDSAQLANALAVGAPIIITTLQKFPFVTEKIGELPKRTYAVIIDEAHSSQGGESTTELKGVLAGAAIREETQAQAGDQGLPDYEEEVLRTMAKRGRQPNISFFAFTATPKYKTLEVFGQPGPDGKPLPFHLYSMRQAIEEDFILDVLQHYTTYRTFFKLLKSVEVDPEVDKRKAARALARFMSLHPHNIAQKTEVMVEHFWHVTRHRIGGKAKAMVLTPSRLHAVRYRQALDKALAARGYSDDVKVLVAFSGTVHDPDVPGVDYTEVSMNGGIREKELPERFATDGYQILVVAEKYQTGFDQPLLHTMYVDKRLAGIQAVQALSRLNRTHPGKEDTFVLDFVNETQEILDAFQPYYEQTSIAEQADHRQLYELQARLDGYQVYYPQEVEEFAKVFYKPKARQTQADHAKMNACLDPAVGRFKLLDLDKQEEFRKVLGAYRNLYAFLSQVIPFQDPDLEKLYAYVRYLLTKLPRRTGPRYRFDDQVTLQYYRLQKISEGAISLKEGEGSPIYGPSAVGTAEARDLKIELSQLIDLLNERFGTDFKPGDQLFFDSIREDAVADPELRQVALANTMENFGYVFLEALEGLFIDRMEQNEEIAAKFFDEPNFRRVVSQSLLREVYEQIRAQQRGEDEARAA